MNLSAACCWSNVAADDPRRGGHGSLATFQVRQIPGSSTNEVRRKIPVPGKDAAFCWTERIPALGFVPEGPQKLAGGQRSATTGKEPFENCIPEGCQNHLRKLLTESSFAAFWHPSGMRSRRMRDLRW